MHVHTESFVRGNQLALPTGAVGVGGAAISKALGREVELCYQSQGADGGDWLGPSVEQTLAALAARGQRQVAWAPVGFIADHVETLYDLDIEARVNIGTVRRAPQGYGLASRKSFTMGTMMDMRCSSVTWVVLGRMANREAERGRMSP